MITLTAPDTYTATIGGIEWQGITQTSQFWNNVQDMIKDGEDVVDVTQPLSNAEKLKAERVQMKCTCLQGRLVLGEETCELLDAISHDPQTPWAMRQTIKNAAEWSRNSQSMTELGYVLGYTPEQIDNLFRIAMTVDV